LIALDEQILGISKAFEYIHGGLGKNDPNLNNVYELMQMVGKDMSKFGRELMQTAYQQMESPGAQIYNTAGFLKPLGTSLGMVKSLTTDMLMDMSLHYGIPNYISNELEPGYRHIEFGRIETNVSIYVEAPYASASPQQPGVPSPKEANAAPHKPRLLHPTFLESFDRPTQRLQHPSGRLPQYEACGWTDATTTPADPLRELRDFSNVHIDVGGLPRPVGAPTELLRLVSQTSSLSNLWVSFQPTMRYYEERPKCGGKALHFNPTACLFDQGWGGYVFQVDLLPPFSFNFEYVGKPLGPGVILDYNNVHSISHYYSRETGVQGAVSTYKSMNHFSPDLLFVSPLTGNCALAETLLSGPIKPKVVYVPFNPLIPPRVEAIPNYDDWLDARVYLFTNSPADIEAARKGGVFKNTKQGEVDENGHVQHRMLDILTIEQIEEMSRSDKEKLVEPLTSQIWLSQCSLRATVRIFAAEGYNLHHVEGTYAVFVWAKVLPTPSPAVPPVAMVRARQGMSERARECLDEAASPTGQAWLNGWYCQPISRYLFNLEVWHPNLANSLCPRPADTCEIVRSELGKLGAVHCGEDIAAWAMSGIPAIYDALPSMPSPNFVLSQYFIERSGRGRCLVGECECFPPYRGPLCENEEPLPRKPWRAVIHFLTPDRPNELKEIQFALRSLWDNFNKDHGYPVIIFHDGLSAASRGLLVSVVPEQLIWFAYVDAFADVPVEHEARLKRQVMQHSHGYRHAIRWRSGPMFLEPAMQAFDYGMTLDTDSYFPAPLDIDPFEKMHAEKRVAMFPHLGRELASVVVNFLQYFLIYCKLHNLDPRRSQLISRLVETNFKWYQQVFELDIEVLDLKFFRDPAGAYQDFFRFMDSTGGFRLYRWGNNPFRTFAVGLFLTDEEVLHLRVPYAHQSFCTCGFGTYKHATCVRAYEPTGPFSCDTTIVNNNVDDRSTADMIESIQPWRGSENQQKWVDPATLIMKSKPDDTINER
jgi:alpha 1,2-mannosyltransferase